MCWLVGNVAYSKRGNILNSEPAEHGVPYEFPLFVRIAMASTSPPTAHTTRRGTGRTPRLDGPSGSHSDHGTSLSIGRRVRASAGLPSGRAMLGALLVSISALGVVAAYRSANVDQRRDVLIIGRDVEPGATLTENDLAFAKMDLVSATDERSFADPGAVVGATALVAMKKGDLISPSMLTEGERSASTPGRMIALALPPEQALGGRLNVGDRVDVLSLAGSGQDAAILVRDARVAFVAAPTKAGIGSAGSVSLSLVVDHEDEALSIVDAHSGNGVMLIRATSADDADTTGTAAADTAEAAADNTAADNTAADEGAGR